MTLLFDRTFMAGGRNRETASFFCRFCNFKVRFKLSLFFNTAALFLGRMILFLHAAICHWNAFTLKENFSHVGMALVSLPLFLLFEIIDLVHGILWLLTFPFWWIHNQLL